MRNRLAGCGLEGIQRCKDCRQVPGPCLRGLEPLRAGGMSSGRHCMLLRERMRWSEAQARGGGGGIALSCGHVSVIMP